MSPAFQLKAPTDMFEMTEGAIFVILIYRIRTSLFVSEIPSFVN